MQLLPTRTDIHVYLLFYDWNYPNSALYHTCDSSSKNWYFCPSICIYTQRTLSYLPHIFEKLVFLSLHMYLYSKLTTNGPQLVCEIERGMAISWVITTCWLPFYVIYRYKLTPQPPYNPDIALVIICEFKCSQIYTKFPMPARISSKH